MDKTNKTQLFMGLVLAMVLIGLPFMLERAFSQYYVYLAAKILIWSLFAVSFNLVLGYGGMMSFGHAAFYGTGAYTCALLLARASWPLPAAIVAAPLVAALVGLAIGFLSVRIRGIFYFAVLTLSCSQLLYIVVFKWRSLTLGDDGIQGIPVPFFISTLDTYVGCYFFILIVTSVCICLLFKIVKSPFGLILKTIRDNAERAAFIGVSILNYRLIAFTLSAFFSGVAGALFVLLETSVSPDVFKWSVSGEVLLMGLLGGMHVFAGPIIGAAVMVLLNSTVTSYTEYWGLVIGMTLVCIVLFFPEGVGGVARAKWLAFRKRKIA
jgi:branched-chain amino acid transport system permease protein